MKKRYLAMAAGLALLAALAGCAAQTGRQASYIDMEAAKTAALAAANVDGADAAFLQTELEQDDGMAYYGIRFTADGQEHYYAVDAMTGAVIESGNTGAQQDANAQGDGSVPQDAAADGRIGEEQASRIALEDAGIREADTAYLRAAYELDDGAAVYDVEFVVHAADGTIREYDYEIDALTGEIRSMDYDAEGYTAQSGTASGTLLSEQAARDMALARVPGAAEGDIRLYLDEDDGRLQYEGRIVYQGMEYEFEIDAYSGAIREWEAESVFD